ncbi:hypothetical protein PJ267_19910 [Arthrobacter sp. OVS8]|nr:hypothetical protein PJ267_19910 [Arthrobacter sp. OVS8]
MPGWLVAVLLLVVPLLVIGGCTLTRVSGDPSSAEQPPPEFVTAAGRGLVLEGQPTRLKAVNFSNHYHRDQDGAELLNSQHHSETDFERAKAIGFNSIRFAFDGDWYVDSRTFSSSGWTKTWRGPGSTTCA